MDYMTARAYAHFAEDHTLEELKEAFDRLAAERDAAQAAMHQIMAETTKRRDAELRELRASIAAKATA